MQSQFPIALFLYMLSLLLGLAGLGRKAEFKSAGRASHASYLLASAATLSILVTLSAGGVSQTVSTFFGGTLLALLALTAVYLILCFTIRIPGASAIFSFFSLLLGVMALFRAHFGEAAEAQHLPGHVACLFLALAGFTISFMLSVVFLVQERLIKSRRLGALFSALPSLELTSRVNFACLSVGTAAFAMGVLSGATALKRLDDPQAVLTDPVILLSALMLIFYILLILLRRGSLERARTFAVTSVLFYPLLIFVFWGAHAKP